MRSMEYESLERKIYFILVILVSLLLCIGTVIFFNIPFGVLFLFLCCCIFIILLPGIAIWNSLNIGIYSSITSICISFAIGYALLIVQYFFAMLWNSDTSFYLVSFFSSLISAIKIVIIDLKKKRVLIAHRTGLDWIALFFFFFLLFINIFSYAANHIGTDVIAEFRCHRDIAYWVNNTVALKISFPADNLFFYGNRLYYHYFSNIPIAFISRISNIDVFSLSFPLYPVIRTSIMMGGTLALIEVITKKVEYKILGIILLVLSTGPETVTFLTFIHAIVYKPIGLDMAYAYSLLFVSVVIVMWQEVNTNLITGIVGVLFFSMSLGCKGPVALVTLVIVGILCLFWLFENKILRAIAFGTALLGAFSLIGAFCLGVFKVLSDDKNVLWRIQFYDREHIIMNLHEGEGIWPIIIDFVHKNIILVLSTKYFLAFRTTFFLLVSLLFVLIICKERILLESQKVILLCSALISLVFGLFMWTMINAGGYSEGQFGMASRIPATLAVLIILEMYNNRIREDYKWSRCRLKSIIILCTVVLLLTDLNTFLFGGYERAGVVKSSYRGIKKTKGVVYPEENELIINKDVVSGLRWLRDNTSENSVIVSDRATINGESNYYLYGIFSERQQYLEGTDMISTDSIIQQEVERRKDLIKRGYYDSDKNAIDDMIREGVDYFVSTKNISPWFNSDKVGLKKIYENEGIVVYSK